MKSAVNKEHEVQAIHPFHQKPSISTSLGKFFPKWFFDKVIVGTTSCFEFDDDNEKTMKSRVLERCLLPKER